MNVALEDPEPVNVELKDPYVLEVNGAAQIVSPVGALHQGSVEATHPAEMPLIQRLTAFSLADPNNRGYVNKAQLARVLGSLTDATTDSTLVDAIMSKADEDGTSDSISHDQFLEAPPGGVADKIVVLFQSQEALRAQFEETKERLLANDSEVLHSRRQWWTEKRYYRNLVFAAIGMVFIMFYSQFAWAPYQRKYFVIDPNLPTITLDIDGCDIFLPGSSFYRHDYRFNYFLLPDAPIGQVDPYVADSPCQWLTSPGAMGASAKDCVVINWLTGDDTTWDAATNTLKFRRSQTPTVGVDAWNAAFGKPFPRDVWWGNSMCKIYLSPKTFAGEIIIKPTSQYSQKTRIFGNYVNQIWNNRPGGSPARVAELWDQRWKGKVTVTPYAAESDDARVFTVGDVLIDLDTYDTAALRLTTTGTARVQMTNVTVAKLDIDLAGTGYVDISTNSAVSAQVTQPANYICLSAGSVQLLASRVELSPTLASATSSSSIQPQQYNISSMVGQVSVNVWSSRLPAAGQYAYEVAGTGKALNFR